MTSTSDISKCAAALALICALAPQAARAETFKGQYTVSYLGLTVARTSFVSEVDAKGFQVSGTMNSAGIATFFDGTKGDIAVSGTFEGKRTRPSAYKVAYTDGPKSKSTTISFKDNKVTAFENVPPLKKRGDDWVPITPGNLVGVTDPMSATMVRADGLDEICSRSVQIFDGEFRADIALSPGPKPAADGQVTCRAKLVPVAGYRKGRKALEYLANKSIIMLTFAQLGSTGVYTPVKATIGTQIGTITIKGRPA